MRGSIGEESLWNANHEFCVHSLGFSSMPYFWRSMSRTLRDRKKDNFMALEQSGMIVVAYDVKFHALSRDAT